MITIASRDGGTRASFIPEKGGVGSSIIMPFNKGERELLFLHDFFWNDEIKDLPGGWPFLFPICARIERDGVAGNYLYDAHLYNLPIHGVSWWLPWEVTSNAPDSLVLTLRDNKQTFQHYPFYFKVELHYLISDGSLTCVQRYTNTGDRPMPYYAGFHPYFLTSTLDADKAQVMINYHPKRRFLYNERLTDVIGEQELFNLPASVADPEVNEQLVELGDDKTITLSFPDGFKLKMLVTGIEDQYLFRFVQLYTQPKQPFICVEPWMGMPNALNTVSGVRWLQPSESESGILHLWCESCDVSY